MKGRSRSLQAHASSRRYNDAMAKSDICFIGIRATFASGVWLSGLRLSTRRHARLNVRLAVQSKFMGRMGFIL